MLCLSSSPLLTASVSFVFWYSFTAEKQKGNNLNACLCIVPEEGTILKYFCIIFGNEYTYIKYILDWAFAPHIIEEIWCMPLSMCIIVLCYFYAVLKTPCMFSSVPLAQLPFPGKLLYRNNHVFVPKAKCLRNAGALVIGVCQWEREERGWREAGEDGGEWKKGTVLFACTLG